KDDIDSLELGFEWSGIPQSVIDAGSASLLCVVDAGEVPACDYDAQPTIDSGTCRALSKAACNLRSSSPIRGILEPRPVPEAEMDFCTQQQTFSHKQFDVYRHYAHERRVYFNRANFFDVSGNTNPSNNLIAIRNGC